ncbi:MAG: phosphopyruvate hydratase, partial [Bacillota bacterium]|nr:phosphopyruvate hydratase [Bacillota bacterium]
GQWKGTGNCPAGRSTGSDEAWELRDGGRRYSGCGVEKAVKNVEGEIKERLVGMDVTDQRKLDRAMIELDGTPNKGRLGANAITAASLACAYAAANTVGLPLYRYLNNNAHVLPVPLLNLLNGGKLTSNYLEFQEFCIFPTAAESFKQAMEWGHEINQHLREIVIKNYGKIAANTGDEGGFATPATGVRETLEHLIDAVEKAGYGKGMGYGFDCAATHWYNAETKKYTLEGTEYTTGELLEYYKKLCRDYPIVSMEDPFDEKDTEGFTRATEELGIQIIGDDFFVTNPAVMQPKMDMGGANALLWKFNQVGSLTEAFDAAQLAFRSGYGIMVSERSGETEDSAIADLVVALDAGQIKTGAGVRSERVAKYNRLLQIEAELGGEAVYAGQNFKNPYRR